MPKLTPMDLQLAGRVIDAVAQGEEKKEIQNVALSDIEVKLRNHKLDTDSALETLSTIMHFSTKEIMKMKVAQMALQMSGVLTAKDDQQQAQAPNITFVFKDSNVNLNGIFNPQR